MMKLKVRTPVVSIIWRIKSLPNVHVTTPVSATSWQLVIWFARTVFRLRIRQSYTTPPGDAATPSTSTRTWMMLSSSVKVAAPARPLPPWPLRSSSAVWALKLMNRSFPPGGVIVVESAVIHGLTNVMPLILGGTMWVERIVVVALAAALLPSAQPIPATAQRTPEHKTKRFIFET